MTNNKVYLIVDNPNHDSSSIYLQGVSHYDIIMIYDYEIIIDIEKSYQPTL